MTEREEFEAWAIEHDLDLTAIFDNQYSDCNTDFAWLAWQASRRTTPDRDSIIEECAEVCEELSAGFSEPGKHRTRMVAAAMQGALTCAYAIRQTKTAPNGEKK